MSQDAGRTNATEEIPFKPLADEVLMRIVHIDDNSVAVMMDAGMLKGFTAA